MDGIQIRKDNPLESKADMFDSIPNMFKNVVRGYHIVWEQEIQKGNDIVPFITGGWFDDTEPDKCDIDMFDIPFAYVARHRPELDDAQIKEQAWWMCEQRIKQEDYDFVFTVIRANVLAFESERGDLTEADINKVVEAGIKNHENVRDAIVCNIETRAKQWAGLSFITKDKDGKMQVEFPKFTICEMQGRFANVLKGKTVCH